MDKKGRDGLDALSGGKRFRLGLPNISAAASTRVVASGQSPVSLL
jgi:hypothetical protein